MKRTAISITALFLLGAIPCVANAFTAIAWSQSGQRGGSVKNAPTKDAAISAAIADCKKSGGGSDCQVFKVTDEPGFVALYATCAKTCGVTAVTGRATAEQARVDGKRECENYYRSACQLASEWQELKGGEALASSKSERAIEDSGLIQSKKFSQAEISSLINKHKTQLKNQAQSQFIDKQLVEKISLLIRSGQINIKTLPDDQRSVLFSVSTGVTPIWESIWSTSGYAHDCRDKIKAAIAEWPIKIEQRYKKNVSISMESGEKISTSDAFEFATDYVATSNSMMIMKCLN